MRGSRHFSIVFAWLDTAVLRRVARLREFRVRRVLRAAFRSPAFGLAALGATTTANLYLWDEKDFLAKFARSGSEKSATVAQIVAESNPLWIARCEFPPDAGVCHWWAIGSSLWIAPVGLLVFALAMRDRTRDSVSLRRTFKAVAGGFGLLLSFVHPLGMFMFASMVFLVALPRRSIEYRRLVSFIALSASTMYLMIGAWTILGADPAQLERTEQFGAALKVTSSTLAYTASFALLALFSTSVAGWFAIRFVAAEEYASTSARHEMPEVKFLATADLTEQLLKKFRSRITSSEPRPEMSPEIVRRQRASLASALRAELRDHQTQLDRIESMKRLLANDLATPARVLCDEVLLFSPALFTSITTRAASALEELAGDEASDGHRDRLIARVRAYTEYVDSALARQILLRDESEMLPLLLALVAENTASGATRLYARALREAGSYSTSSVLVLAAAYLRDREARSRALAAERHAHALARIVGRVRLAYAFQAAHPTSSPHASIIGRSPESVWEPSARAIEVTEIETVEAVRDLAALLACADASTDFVDLGPAAEQLAERLKASESDPVAVVLPDYSRSVIRVLKHLARSDQLGGVRLVVLSGGRRRLDISRRRLVFDLLEERRIARDAVRVVHEDDILAYLRLRAPARALLLLGTSCYSVDAEERIVAFLHQMDLSWARDLCGPARARSRAELVSTGATSDAARSGPSDASLDPILIAGASKCVASGSEVEAAESLRPLLEVCDYLQPRLIPIPESGA